MGKITYADEIDARFGVPWTDDFKYVKGELECALSDEEIDRLTVQDPVRAETLTRLLLDQPNSEKEDPIEWGWTLPGWRRVMENWKDTKIHVCLGGNSSSKTTFASRLLVHLAQNIPEAEIRSMHVSEERSISDSQRYIWDSLPARYKRSKKKSENHSLCNTLRRMDLMQVKQSCHPPIQMPSVGVRYTLIITGSTWQTHKSLRDGLHIVLHADEEIPENIFNTLLARLTDNHGRLILTFTTLQGYTPLVNSLLKGATTVRSKYSALMDKELPLEQVSANWPDCRIYYFLVTGFTICGWQMNLYVPIQ